MMAAMKNVLSPISDTRITVTDSAENIRADHLTETLESFNTKSVEKSSMFGGVDLFRDIQTKPLLLSQVKHIFSQEIKIRQFFPLVIISLLLLLTLHVCWVDQEVEEEGGSEEQPEHGSDLRCDHDLSSPLLMMRVSCLITGLCLYSNSTSHSANQLRAQII